MGFTTHDYRPLARRLVQRLVSQGQLRSCELMEALMSVPRHQFLKTIFLMNEPASWFRYEPSYERAHDLSLAYRDESLAVHTRESLPSTVCTAPSVVVTMIEALNVKQGDRVLELGTGSGYTSALLAKVVGDAYLVTTVELEREAVYAARENLTSIGMSRINVVHGNARYGHYPNAPYDRILANFSIRFVPRSWLQQLKPDGKLIVPRMTLDTRQLLHLTKSNGLLIGYAIGASGFPEMAQTEGESVRVTAFPVPRIAPPDPTPLHTDSLMQAVFREIVDDDFRFYYGLQQPTHALTDLALDGSEEAPDFRPAVIDLQTDAVLFGPKYEVSESSVLGSWDILKTLSDEYQNWNLAGRPTLQEYSFSALASEHSDYAGLHNEVASSVSGPWYIPAGEVDSLDWSIRLSN